MTTDQPIVAPVIKAPLRAPDLRSRPHEPRKQGCRSKNAAYPIKRTKKSGGTRQPCTAKGEGRRGTRFLNYPPQTSTPQTPPHLTPRRLSTAPLHARPPDRTRRRLSTRGADKPGRRSWRFVASQRPKQQPEGHPHPPPPTPRRRRAWAPRLEARRPPTNHACPPDPVARQGGRREGALAAPPQHR
ncbi:uncharacterized protein LOC125235887 [Leguminivora glycinivorella]|uniref:uncharacterized protein LOC125235887 n=1 Tax=Leguminivora glycinivorella TaxID=1035111 RepID=UPI00200DE34D|nr:uncharacterized protein LOC125235887 [Leguminivora glycinivorella]